MTTFSNRHNGGPAIEDDSGWVAIARSMRTHAVVGFDLFVNPCDANKGALQPALAWIDLIMECRFKDGTVLNNGRPMTLRRGQMLGANLWLAQRWNWTPKTVRGFLSRLEANGMISFENDGIIPSTSQEDEGNKKGRSKGRYANTITVCNYSQYQMGAHTQGQVESPLEGKSGAGPGPTKGDIYKEEQREQRKQGNNETSNSPPETPPVDSRAGGPDDMPDLPGLNGSTSLIVRTMATWLNPHAPDIATARSTIAEAIKIYGDAAVRDGFAEYKADIADGRVRVPTVKSLYGFFRQAKGRPEKAGAQSTESTADRWKRMLDESKTGGDRS
jgi:hypothetical protein